MTTDALPLLGPPIVTHHEAVETFLAKRRTDNGYSKPDLNHIFRLYADACSSTELCFAVAAAQLAHEAGWLTSWWSARPRRNGSGLGVTGVTYVNQPKVPAAFDPSIGKWRAGLSFDSWEDSVTVQVGRLLAYALAPGSVTPEQENAIVTANRFRPIPAKIRGTAPTLRALGAAHNPSGSGWAAPGTTYGAAIAKAIDAILAH